MQTSDLTREPTPEIVVDRMCDAVIAHDAVAVMAEVQFFWGAEWPIDQVARPLDTEPLRLALKACLLERMAEVWTAPPKGEPSAAPAWCREIAALDEEFSVVSDDYRSSFSMESPIFRKRNIFAPRDYLFFV